MPSQSRHPNPSQAPGPQGAALQATLQALRQAPLPTLLTLRQQFGDVVRLAATPYPVYLLSHPDAVQHVLHEQARNYRKGVFFQTVATLQGEGLLTSDGALWQQQRRLLQALFQPRQLATLAPIVQEESQALVQAWQQAAQSGAPVHVSAWLHRFTFRVLARGVLGLPGTILTDLGRQLQALGAQLIPYLRLPWRFPEQQAPESSPPDAVLQAIADYQTLAQQIIHLRRQTLQDTRTTDLLTLLLHAQARSGSPSDQQIRDEIITFIGAGTETAAQALSWTLYMLARHPASARSLQAGISRVVGARLPSCADLPALPDSWRAIEEVLRLYPPAALIPRQTNTADTLSGYHLPPDSVVLLSPYVTHRHPAFWESPEAFQPERFRADQVRARHRFAFFPFGAGSRHCIGQPLARLAMHLALSALLHAYSFHPASSEPVEPELVATLRPRGGLWLTLQRRH
ncbi:MAG: cytochrome P450 [Candidatus Tectimicrobiota bacterium]